MFSFFPHILCRQIVEVRVFSKKFSEKFIAEEFR